MTRSPKPIDSRRVAVGVFCGSRPGSDASYAAAARKTGELLAALDAHVVYGGGSRGLMGELADAVLRQRGSITGVIPQFLVDLEIAHTGLTELIVVGSMHERKKAISDRADVFLMLPGGMGTLDEFVEMLTWHQLGLHSKRFGILNVGGFFDRLMWFMEHAARHGFADASMTSTLQVHHDPEVLVSRLLTIESLHAKPLQPGSYGVTR